LEIFKIEQEVVIHGVKVKRVNPKAIKMTELIGELNPDNGAWFEG
jgi:hypothetical protein